MLHWSLEFQSAFPAWLNLLFGLILAAGAFFLNHRDKNPSRLRRALRFAAAFLLFLGVSQLALVERKVPVPGLALILDDSPSMNLPAGSEESRLKTAESLAERLIQVLRRANVPVRTFRLSEIVPSDPAGTPLGTAVLSTLRTDVFSGSDGRECLAGVVLLTDGISTDGTAAETIGSEARKRRCALFPAVIGPTDGKEVPQIYAEWQNPASTFLAGETSELKFRVSALNLPENHPVSVRLKAPDGRTLAEKTVLFPEKSGSAALVFNWLPEAEGPQTLRLETMLDPTALNPALSLPLTVAERSCRVLLIASGPDWEFRNLRNLLAREPSIQLETWAPASSPLAMDSEQDEFLRADFPPADELSQIDAVIFDSVSPQDLGTEYVSRLRSAWLDEPAETARPHGLVVLAGRNFRPESWLRSELSPLLPVSLEGAAFQNIPAGAEAVFLPAGQAFCAANGVQLPEKLPPVYSYWTVPAQTRNAQTLAEIRTSAGAFPLLILGRSDRVSVLFHATDNSWRWRKNDDSFFRAYWVQTLHALRRNETRGENQPAKTPEIPEIPGETSKVEQVTAAEKLPVEIPAQPVDFRRTVPDRATMAEWAERSGGSVLDPENQDAQRMAEEILLTLRSQPAAPETVETSHRFITWPLVWLALCAVLAVLFATEGKRRSA
ncbi:MAG: hypothetical protein IJQ31_09650 [Thermoguttaceae bacterium]|nr:hypothetical protein [Thermoguttaceae bacterium]